MNEFVCLFLFHCCVFCFECVSSLRLILSFFLSVFTFFMSHFLSRVSHIRVSLYIFPGLSASSSWSRRSLRDRIPKSVCSLAVDRVDRRQATAEAPTSNFADHRLLGGGEGGGGFNHVVVGKQFGNERDIPRTHRSFS